MGLFEYFTAGNSKNNIEANRIVDQHRTVGNTSDVETTEYESGLTLRHVSRAHVTRENIRKGPNRAIRTGGGFSSAVVTDTLPAEIAIDRTVELAKRQKPFLEAVRLMLRESGRP